jgi:hypothetical protein
MGKPTSAAKQEWQTDLNLLIENGCTPQGVGDFLDRFPDVHRMHVVNEKNGRGWTPLRAAVSTRQGAELLSIVQVLLENGADPCIGNDRRDNVTPVHKACLLGNIELVQLLCTRCPKAVSSRTTKARLQPIHYAVQAYDKAKRIPLINLFIREFNVDAAILTRDLNSLLHYAGAKKDRATYQFLQQAGMDENVPNRCGHTARDKLNGL